MGWTGYYVGEKVNKKAECDRLFDEPCYKVLKSVVRGNVYYAAVKHMKKRVKDESGNYSYIDLPKEEQTVFAAVTLISVEKGEFFYKDMDETCGPYNYDCPVSILNMLSPTTSTWALEWREKCRKMQERRKIVYRSPIGTIIETTKDDGTKDEYVYVGPCYQFRKPFWIHRDGNSYCSKKNLMEMKELRVTKSA